MATGWPKSKIPAPEVGTTWFWIALAIAMIPWTLMAWWVLSW
jgi:hypothetical protein